ncbi:hypothetical protein QG37_04477 [Candidozyma auris]|uniref:Uncharacterized protein n=1 Tax=Candidozyma auris TaxID=498019 RepID=A0A0L0NY48_CANAR|nr:hypothetical protein QG37_04477 [[Candida] auris]
MEKEVVGNQSRYAQGPYRLCKGTEPRGSEIREVQQRSLKMDERG